MYTLMTHDTRDCPATQQFRIVISASALTADFLRISEAVIYEPIVFVDISVPLPEQTRWLLPDDPDVSIKRQTAEMLELIFTRTGDFEIGMAAQLGNCTSTLYKIVTIGEAEEGKDGDSSGGRKGDQEEIEITVYPNPMHETVTIQLSVPTRDEVKLRMLSGADGKQAASRILQGQHDYLVNWNIPEVTAGVYHLICDYNGKVYARKIIVVR